MLLERKGKWGVNADLGISYQDDKYVLKLDSDGACKIFEYTKKNLYVLKSKLYGLWMYPNKTFNIKYQNKNLSFQISLQGKKFIQKTMLSCLWFMRCMKTKPAALYACKRVIPKYKMNMETKFQISFSNPTKFLVYVV